MKKIIIPIATLFLFSCSGIVKNNTNTTGDSKPTENTKTETQMNETNFYNLTYNSPSGEEKSMKQYEGEVVLIVNTATKCGLTPQFAGLEELHETYAKKGLKVLGFPCNQFGGQEPLSNENMVETCKVNHGVTFELAEKIEVNGNNSHPVYAYLKSQQKIDGDNEIRWNFEKFLVDRNGEIIKRFSPQTTPAELITEIENAL